MFDVIYDDHDPVRVTVANGQKLTALCVGTVRLPLVSTDGTKHEITLHNVVYHPSFHNNLLSVRRLWKDSRINTKFAGGNSRFKDVQTGVKYQFDEDPSGGYKSRAYATKIKLDSGVLHSRFGHCGAKRLRQMQTRCTGFPEGDIVDHDPSKCEACKAGDMKHKHFKSSSREFSYFGERLSSDLCGPFPKSVEGYRYMLNIVDAHTNWLTTIPLRSKSSGEVQHAMTEFLRQYKRYLPIDDRKITWHTDNGGEFMSDDLNEFCREMCIHRSFSVPYEAPRNAHAERMWGIILRTMRISLAESGVHVSLWPYAASHATLIHNSLPSSSLLNNITPTEALTGKPPEVRRFRTWGCAAFYYVPKHERAHKLSPRAVPAINLGYDASRDAYYVYVPSLNRITSAINLTFNERKFLTFDETGVRGLPRAARPLGRTEYHYREPRDRPRDRPRRQRKRTAAAHRAACEVAGQRANGAGGV